MAWCWGGKEGLAEICRSWVWAQRRSEWDSMAAEKMRCTLPTPMSYSTVGASSSDGARHTLTNE